MYIYISESWTKFSGTAKKYYRKKTDEPEPKMIDNETMALFHETAAISKPKQQPIIIKSILTWAR